MQSGQCGSIFCSAAMGIAFGIVSVLWLGFIFNDTVIEITLTLAVSYIAFFTVSLHISMMFISDFLSFSIVLFLMFHMSLFKCVTFIQYVLNCVEELVMHIGRIFLRLNPI